MGVGSSTTDISHGMLTPLIYVRTVLSLFSVEGWIWYASSRRRLVGSVRIVVVVLIVAVGSMKWCN